jgi:hypothetical protein
MRLRIAAQLIFALFRIARPTQVVLIFFVYCLGVLMLFVQLVAWWWVTDFCCLMSVFGSS